MIIFFDSILAFPPVLYLNEHNQTYDKFIAQYFYTDMPYLISLCCTFTGPGYVAPAATCPRQIIRD